jgi:multicomponent Na+:H+ antiporter subunit E
VILRRLPATLWLVVLWAALWGDASIATFASGTLVAIGVQAALPRAAPGLAGTVRPLRFAFFLVYFLYKVVEANLVVAWEVVTPGSRINQAIVAVPIRGASDVVITSIANTISLTPGTLTLEVRRDPPTLYIHVLHLRSVEDTRRDVLYLELLLMRALAPDQHEEIAWLEEACGKGTRRRWTP